MTELDNNEFSNICPYSDEEAASALSKVADHPMVLAISKFIFPKEPITFLRKTLKSISSVDEFQQVIMAKAVDWVINNTIKNFSYEGMNILRKMGSNAMNPKVLFMSNHRDIILDPAFTQYILGKNGLPMTEICVGDNLLSSKTVEYLLRSNRMITVIRGISARELYLSSQLLSKYIRNSIVSGKSSVWLAQRQGRTKDGFDVTEQGLLKMLDMSGTKSFTDNFLELNIIPLSISYEYEPCDARKARELLISRTQKYVKGPKEDMHSIVVGIKQMKGNVHLSIGETLTREEIEEASKCDKNDRYQFIRDVVSKRIVRGYKLWKTNYIAYDILSNTSKYAEHYTMEEMEDFKKYTEKKLSGLESSLNREELREIFLGIYANPVKQKEDLTK